MYFGEFLLKQKLIDESRLAEALVEQICMTPVPCKVLFEAGKISAGDMIRIFSVQFEKGLTFRQACQELSIWNDEMDAILLSETKKSRPPLGNIILRQGSVSLDTLTSALDEYLSREDLEPIEDKSTSATTSESSVQISSEAKDFGKIEDSSQEVAVDSKGPDEEGFLVEASDFPDLDETVLEEFLKVADDVVLTGLDSTIDFIDLNLKEADAEVFTATLKSIFDDVHKMRGVACLLQAKLTESACVGFEKRLAPLRSDEASITEDSLNEFKSAGRVFCALICSIREVIREHRSEATILQDAALKEKLDFLSQGLDLKAA